MLFFVAGVIFGIILANIYFLYRYGILIGMYKTAKCREVLDKEMNKYMNACKEYNESQKHN